MDSDDNDTQISNEDDVSTESEASSCREMDASNKSTNLGQDEAFDEAIKIKRSNYGLTKFQQSLKRSVKVV